MANHSSLADLHGSLREGWQPGRRTQTNNTRMKEDIVKAIDSERDYQAKKWPGHTHGVEGYLLIMLKCMWKAVIAWIENRGNDAALSEVRQVVAVGVACMEENGAPLRVSGDVVPPGSPWPRPEALVSMAGAVKAATAIGLGVPGAGQVTPVENLKPRAFEVHASRGTFRIIWAHSWKRTIDGRDGIIFLDKKGDPLDYESDVRSIVLLNG